MRLFLFFCGCLGLMAMASMMKPSGYTRGVQAAVDRFKTEAAGFAGSCTALKKAVEALGGEKTAETLQTRQAARLALVECRCRYKTIEAFLEYFFRSSATIYNRAPKFEAEEGGMEYQSPVGLQVIESMLYDPHVDKKALLEQVDAVESAASDLPALLYGLRADDKQLLESLRVELIRIMALDITGYEAPLLKSGIRESRVALNAFGEQLRPYMGDDKRSDSVRLFLRRAQDLLAAGDGIDRTVSFDRFDRLEFLRNALLPLQRQLGLLIHERGLELNTSKTLNYTANDLFSADAFAPERFPGGDSETLGRKDSETLARNDHAFASTDREGAREALVALGKQLFTDKRLSGNGQKSCASCHDPEKGFTDRLPVSIGFDGHQRLDRNAPSLLYSAYQFDQFWDGRVKSLEQQIRTVLRDAREMHADTVKEADVLAIAAYVRSLHPFNSDFDRYIRRESDRFPAGAKRGANLFMGKAQCATCHFIPLFNGLIPPDYTLTEFEVLGTTAIDPFGEKNGRDDQRKPGSEALLRSGTGQGRLSSSSQGQLRLSADEGRYRLYPFDFFKGAFKTPTVRNAALTYPYMHNGVFGTLETVMEFYNQGGGAGLGLSVPDQTLSSSPLLLTAAEKKDIILFLHTLTDSVRAGS
jgi:cytochrome c peroxidase